MQHQAVGILHKGCIQGIAVNGVSDGLQMHAQLVAAPGQGHQLQQRSVLVGVVLHAAPQRHAGLALCVYFLQGSVGPICHQWLVDGVPRVANWQSSMHPGGVFFFNVPGGKHHAQLALAVCMQGKHHQARGRHVQTVNHQRLGMTVLQPAQHAILFVRAAARYAQHTRRFIQHQQVFICKQHGQHMGGCFAAFQHTDKLRSSCCHCALRSGWSQASTWRLGIPRSQVNCRLASCRLAAMPVSRKRCRSAAAG